MAVNLPTNLQAGPDAVASPVPARERLLAVPSRFAVSVVIPTCRRPDLLQRCIDALLHQVGIKGAIELIVVDDARLMPLGPPRHYLCPSGPVQMRVLYPPPGRRGPAAARNAGWRAAHSQFIAFTDDDTVPDPGWLAEGLHAMHAGVDAAWGRVVVPLPPRPTDSERNVGGLHGAEFVTANCFVRRDALALVDGFDERFARPWREDSDLYFNLLERGLEVVPVATAIVVHPARRAAPATALRQHRNLLYEALLYKKHPRLYREKISSGPPHRYYLALLLGGLAIGGMAAGQPALAGLGAAGWTGLTLWLTARRLAGGSRHWLNVADVVLSTPLIPVVAVFWRLLGAFRYRVPFV